MVPVATTRTPADIGVSGLRRLRRGRRPGSAWDRPAGGEHQRQHQSSRHELAPHCGRTPLPPSRVPAAALSAQMTALRCSLRNDAGHSGPTGPSRTRLQDLPLPGAGDQQPNLGGGEELRHSHRHPVVEGGIDPIPGQPISSLLGELDHPGRVIRLRSRLVHPKVPVGPEPENRQVDAFPGDGVDANALGVEVGGVYVYPVKPANLDVVESVGGAASTRTSRGDRWAVR